MRLFLRAAAGLIFLLASARTGYSDAPRIWDTRAKRYVSEESLVKALAASDYVLLGELHDNPAHHKLQAKIIEALAQGPKRAVIMEMLRRDQQKHIARHFREHPGDVTGFAAAVSWHASGWPPWALYAPVVSAAVAANFPIQAGDVSRAWLTRVRKEGLSVLEPAWLEQTGLAEPAPPQVAATLRADIIAGHCGHAPEKHIPRMLEIQRLRDAHLASQLAEEPTAILIAGAGHVRKDVAVPLYLQRLAPGKKTVAVAFVEVTGTAVAPPDAGRYDYLWFTEPATREDPCLELRERFTPKPARPDAASRAPRGRSGSAATSPTLASPFDLKSEKQK